MSHVCALLVRAAAPPSEGGREPGAQPPQPRPGGPVDPDQPGEPGPVDPAEDGEPGSEPDREEQRPGRTVQRALEVARG